MVNFETDEAHQEREIDAKTREITDLFHHAENVLKRFGKQSEDTTLSVADRTVRKNMQMSMARKIQGLSMSFRSTQKVGIVCFSLFDAYHYLSPLPIPSFPSSIHSNT